MQPVQDSQEPVVCVELLVVEVVEVRVVLGAGHPGPAVAAVVELRAQHGEDDPGHEGERVSLDEGAAEGEGHRIRHQHLQRMAVGRAEAYRRGELVVDLVESAVEVDPEDLRVQEPVRVEEDELVEEDDGHELEEHPLARRQRQRRLDAEAELRQEHPAERGVRDNDADLPREDVLANLCEQLLVEALLLLDPELVKHVGPDNHVDSQQDEAVHPVHHDGDCGHPHRSATPRRIALHEASPPCLREEDAEERGDRQAEGREAHGRRLHRARQHGPGVDRHHRIQTPGAPDPPLRFAP
mmetsp:Transcript_71468/g.209872  ORF Transcript_71468/g.209872 Transcript_71468/m.209872 type:complete len:297 (+) Transcript_71468:360-1250(+)